MTYGIMRMRQREGLAFGSTETLWSDGFAD